jgi:hypothetical protein
MNRSVVLNRSVVWAVAAALALALAACGGKKSTAQQGGDGGWDEDVEYDNHDNTIFGLCSDGSAMNTLQMITDSGDTLTLSTMPAQEQGQVFGGYAVGDRMAVLPNEEGTAAVMVVNLSTLMGKWVMPNPLDGSSYMGIEIKDGGIAESINQGSVIYKTWRMLNGRLELVSVREGGGDFEETEYCQLLFLTADSLSFRDSEDVFEFTRPGRQDDLDDEDVELEEGSFDDFIM